jgi:hypothetical protein
MRTRIAVCAVVLTISTLAFAALAPVAGADAVYHTEHLRLMPIGGEPLRSGFVQNIKAEGPTIYAHEIYVLNGARPNTTYIVTNNFYVGGGCTGEVWPFDTAVMTTDAGGNTRADITFTPADLVGVDLGVHGVFWTVRDAAGNLAYETVCTAVTID